MIYSFNKWRTWDNKRIIHLAKVMQLDHHTSEIQTMIFQSRLSVTSYSLLTEMELEPQFSETNAIHKHFSRDLKCIQGQVDSMS